MQPNHERPSDLAESSSSRPVQAVPMSRVASFDGLSALPPECESLFDQAGRNSIFLTKDWFATLAQRTLDDDETVRGYLCASGNGAESGPLLLTCFSRQTPWLLRSFTRAYSCEFGLVSGDAPINEQSLMSLAAALKTDSHRWAEIQLDALAPDSPWFQPLVAALRKSGFLVDTYFNFGNWYEDTGGRSYDDYLKARPSVLRNTIKRKGRKLEKLDNVEIKIVFGGPELEQAIADYEGIYALSWKNAERYPDFMRDLIRTCARQGSLRLGLIYVDGKAAAAQFWIAHQHRAIIYKLAYDPAFEKLSVGSVLTAHLMRHVIDEDRVREVDYGSGDDSYKKDWMSHRREKWGIVAFNPMVPRGLAGAAKHFGGRLMRNFKPQPHGRAP
jgi:hypothetical protein